MTASFGLAIYPDDAEDATKLFRIADERMYALKKGPISTKQITLGIASAHLQ
jgi:diguanylate cyclase